MDSQPAQGTGSLYSARERWSVLISTLLGYWLDFYNILVISFLMTAIQNDLGISLTQAGVITSVTLAASVVGGVLFGWIGDRYGRKNALMWSFILFSLAAIASAFSWNYASLLVFRIIAGVGIGGEWGVGMTLYNEVWSPKRRGFGSSVIQSMSLIGIATSALAATWALGAFGPGWGWRVALLFGAAPLLFLIFVRIYMPESKLWSGYSQLRDSGMLPSEKARQKSSLREILSGPSLLYTISALVMLCGYMFAFYAVSIFMPTYMGEGLGASGGAIQAASILVALLCVPVFWGIGWFADLWGRRTGVLFASVVMLVGYAGIYFGSQGDAYAGSIWSWTIMWWYLVWTAGAGAICIFGPWLAELYPVEFRSTATSTIYMVGRTMSAAAPAVVGAVAVSTGNIAIGMAIGGIGVLVVLVAAGTLPETAGRVFDVIEQKDVTRQMTASDLSTDQHAQHPRSAEVEG